MTDPKDPLEFLQRGVGVLLDVNLEFLRIVTCYRKTEPLGDGGESGWLILEKGSEHERKAV